MQKTKSLSKSLLIFLIVGFAILLVFLALFSYNFRPGGTSKAISVTVPSASFDSSTSELTFSLNNPVSHQIQIISVSVNQTSCVSNFLPVKADDFIPEACTVLGISFVKGQVIEYEIFLDNGQGILGDTTAL